jgi:hypothetical protein
VSCAIYTVLHARHRHAYPNRLVHQLNKLGYHVDLTDQPAA